MKRKLFCLIRVQEVRLIVTENIFIIILFIEKPLVFGDIQGGFYLLGFGYFLTFIVHIILILKVKLCTNKS